MKNLKFVLIVGIVLVAAIFISFIFINKTGYAVSVEKCNSLDFRIENSDSARKSEDFQHNDDCWHSLAHQTFNKTYCDKIKDNETREHCFEHIPS